MRIVYHHRTSARDGGAVHIDSLIEALRALGAEVVLVAPSMARRSTAATRRPHWTSSLRKRLPRLLHELAELAYNIPEAWRLWREVARVRPDVIYERSNLFLLSGSWVARATRTPLICEINAPYHLERSKHGGIALARLAERTERGTWAAADAIITVTEVLGQIVAQRGVAHEQVHVMPNGIDPAMFSRAAIEPDAKRHLGLGSFTVLGFTGYVRDWNGLDGVVDLLATAEGSGLFLLVVGDGPGRADVESRARRLGVAERVRFTGVVRRRTIASYVSAFDIALQPAANPYASPLKLFEYMALGRAIVAPDQPNIREVLTHDRDALLFDPAEREGLVRAVVALLEQPALRRRLGAGAADTVERLHLSWRNNAERVLALARRLALSGERTACPVDPGASTSNR